MSTRIVFDNGLNLVVAQDEEDVADALAAGDDQPVTLRSRGGRLWKVHPKRVVLIESLRSAGPAALA